MKNVQSIGLGLALLIAPAAHAISLPTISLPSLPTIGMPESRCAQAAAAAALIVAGYGIYKSGIIGKVIDKAIDNPKKTLALLVAAVATTVAYKCGYNPFANNVKVSTKVDEVKTEVSANTGK